MPTESAGVFAFSCYLDSATPTAEFPHRLCPVEVHLLVSGEYLLTLHEEPVSLPDLLAAYAPEARSEQYAVYAILDAMVASAFDALNEVELTRVGIRPWPTATGRVDGFVRKPRQRLERASPRWRYIHTHFGIGYRFAAEAERRASTSPPARERPSAPAAMLPGIGRATGAPLAPDAALVRVARIHQT
jgi:hypothetical protein